MLVFIEVRLECSRSIQRVWFLFLFVWFFLVGGTWDSHAECGKKRWVSAGRWGQKGSVPGTMAMVIGEWQAAQGIGSRVCCCCWWRESGGREIAKASWDKLGDVEANLRSQGFILLGVRSYDPSVRLGWWLGACGRGRPGNGDTSWDSFCSYLDWSPA